MNILKLSLSVLTLVGVADLANAQVCGDKLPPHAVSQGKQLWRKLVNTRTAINAFVLARDTGETWEDVAIRLDQAVLWMKNLTHYTGCLSNSDCRIVNFQSYPTISGVNLSGRFPFSNFYDVTHNNENTIVLMREVYQLYAAKSSQIRQNALTDEGIIYTTQGGSNTVPPHAVCASNTCMATPGVPITEPRTITVSDGIETYTSAVPMGYTTPIIAINASP